jgi:hypothetical protein
MKTVTLTMSCKSPPIGAGSFGLVISVLGNGPSSVSRLLR